MSDGTNETAADDTATDETTADEPVTDAPPSDEATTNGTGADEGVSGEPATDDGATDATTAETHAADADPDGLLAVSNLDAGYGELQILDRDLRVVGTHLFDRTPKSQFSRGVDWTDRGIILVTSTDGQPQEVSVFPVDLPAA